jgi:hypothetical protein
VLARGSLGTAAGTLSAAIGVAAISGLAAGSGELVEIVLGYPYTEPSTALCFLLSGVGLLAVGVFHSTWGLFFGAAVAAVAGIRGAEYFFDVGPLITQLASVTESGDGSSEFDRMPPNAALSFCAVGAALLFLCTADSRRFRPLVIGVLSSVIVALAGMAVLGHATGVREAYRWRGAGGMSLHTAVVVLLMGLALLARVWRDGRVHGSRAPAWLPLSVGAGAATVVLCMWRALASNKRTEEG